MIRQAVLWDTNRGKHLQKFQGHTGEIRGVAQGADGKLALTGSDDQTAILWDSVGSKKLQNFRGHSDRVWKVALSSDGKRALTGAGEGTATSFCGIPSAARNSTISRGMLSWCDVWC